MVGEPPLRFAWWRSRKLQCSFTLDFWIDGGWYVGKLREVPSVFSQGESLEELKTNIQDAYRLMVEEAPPLPVAAFRSTEVQVEAG